MNLEKEPFSLGSKKLRYLEIVKRLDQIRLEMMSTATR